MKEVSKVFSYNGNEYRAVFNLNAMEEIQQEYGSMAKWTELTDGKESEVDIKALVFGIGAMINEAIDIDNETRDEKIPFLTHKQVARIVSDIGFSKASETMQGLVIDSVKDTSDESKNE